MAKHDSQTPLALEAQNLTLAWGAAKPVVTDVSLGVQAGELVALVGRSGTGKTTLLHALAGLTQPRAGKVLVHGVDTTGVPGKLSYMLQKDLLLPSKRIIDNVCLPLTLRGVSRNEAHAQAEPLFERFGLEGTQQSWPRELSGGMRQRAALLRTYLMGCDVMLLDEPFSALDAITRRELRSWFSEMARELSISALVITHDVDEAVALASRALVLTGDPRQGKPSTITAELDITHGAADAAAHDLLALLG